VYFNAAPGSPAWSKVVGRDRLNAPKDGRYDFFSRELFALVNGSGDADAMCLPRFELPTTDESMAQDYPYLLISQPLITVSPTWQGVIPTLQEALGLQSKVRWESWVEINAQAAEALHIEDGDAVWIESAHDRVKAAARLTPGMWPNAVYLPGGMGHHSLVQWGRSSEKASVIGVNPVSLAPHSTEPLSGQASIFPLRVKIYKAWEGR
jgi:anaerobic selenocysteine-containing dehydrogenase